MYREKLSRYFIIPLRLLLKNKKIKKKKENSINQRFSLFYYSIVGHLLKTKKQKKERKKNSINQRSERDVIKCFANYVNVAVTPRKFLTLKSVTVVFIFTWPSTQSLPNDIKTWP